MPEYLYGEHDTLHEHALDSEMATSTDWRH